MVNPLMKCLICNREINKFDPIYNDCPVNCPFDNPIIAVENDPPPRPLIDIPEPTSATPPPGTPPPTSTTQWTSGLPDDPIIPGEEVAQISSNDPPSPPTV